MALDNVSFGIYINVTCGIGEEPPCTDDPQGELIDWHMAGVARHVDKFNSHTTFYRQAAEGTLPAFSWVSPNIEVPSPDLSSRLMLWRVANTAGTCNI